MFLLATVMYFWVAVLDPSTNPTSTPTDFVSLISTASGPVLMAIIIVGAMKEWWFPGKSVKRILAERDALLQLALGGQDVGQRALTAAEILARKKPL